MFLEDLMRLLAVNRHDDEGREESALAALKTWTMGYRPSFSLVAKVPYPSSRLF